MGQSTPNYLVERNLPLPTLLERATEKELCVLADLITDKGKGRLMLDKHVKELIILFQMRSKLYELSDTLAKEICAYGSHSTVNVIRHGQGAEYLAILKEVAKILGVKSKETTDVYSFERYVLAALIHKAVNGKSNDVLYVELNCNDRQSNTLIVGSINNTSKNKRKPLVETILNVFDLKLVDKLVKRIITENYILLLCSGIGAVTKFGAPAGIMTSLTIAARLNPLMTAVSGVASAFSLSGPAYRIVIPAVVQIALIRYHQIASETQQFCKELESCL